MTTQFSLEQIQARNTKEDGLFVFRNKVFSIETLNNRDPILARKLDPILGQIGDLYLADVLNDPELYKFIA